jgi:hypothetical protein
MPLTPSVANAPSVASRHVGNRITLCGIRTTQKCKETVPDTKPIEPTHTDAPRKVDVRRGFRWFAAEFLVVVAGILAALMVQQFHQYRQERTRERFYLDQLHRDFISSRAVLRTARDQETRNTDGYALIWRAIHSSAARPPSDTLAEWFRYSSGLSQPRIVTGTLSALVTSGDIRLIRDDSLRSVLIRLAASLSQSQSHLDRNAAALVGLETERNLWVDPVEITTSYREGWGMQARHFPVDWDALLKNRSFNAFISSNWNASVQRWGNLMQILSELEQAQRLLATRLGQPAEQNPCSKRNLNTTGDYAGTYRTTLTNVRVEGRGDSINLSGFGLGGRFGNAGPDHFCNENGNVQFQRDGDKKVVGFRVELFGRTFEASRMKE